MVECVYRDDVTSCPCHQIKFKCSIVRCGYQHGITGIGKDHTIFAKEAGRVKFEVKGPLSRKYVVIEPVA